MYVLLALIDVMIRNTRIRVVVDGSNLRKMVFYQLLQKHHYEQAITYESVKWAINSLFSYLEVNNIEVAYIAFDSVKWEERAHLYPERERNKIKARRNRASYIRYGKKSYLYDLDLDPVYIRMFYECIRKQVPHAPFRIFGRNPDQ